MGIPFTASGPDEVMSDCGIFLSTLGNVGTLQYKVAADSDGGDSPDSPAPATLTSKPNCSGAF